MQRKAPLLPLFVTNITSLVLFTTVVGCSLEVPTSKGLNELQNSIAELDYLDKTQIWFNVTHDLNDNSNAASLNIEAKVEDFASLKQWHLNEIARKVYHLSKPISEFDELNVSLFQNKWFFITNTYSKSFPPQNILSIAHVKSGIFTNVTTLDESIENNSTHTGLIRTFEGDESNLEETNVVQAELGTTFGVCHELFSSVPDVFQITRTVAHPTMQVPEKGESLGYSYPIPYEVVTMGEFSYCWNYQFEYDWELVAGSWSLELSHEDQVLVHAKFEVVSP